MVENDKDPPAKSSTDPPGASSSAGAAAAPASTTATTPATATTNGKPDSRHSKSDPKALQLPPTSSSGRSKSLGRTAPPGPGEKPAGMAYEVPTKDIRAPHPNDVLCGRGGGTNNHAGNEKFRDLVNQQKVLYLHSSKRDKPLVSRRIVQAVRAQVPPGRFLQKDDSTGLWYDIGDQKAREKTSQALREGAPEIRREISIGGGAAAAATASAYAALTANAVSGTPGAQHAGAPPGVLPPGYHHPGAPSPYGAAGAAGTGAAGGDPMGLRAGKASAGGDDKQQGGAGGAGEGSLEEKHQMIHQMQNRAARAAAAAVGSLSFSGAGLAGLRQLPLLERSRLLGLSDGAPLSSLPLQQQAAALAAAGHFGPVGMGGAGAAGAAHGLSPAMGGAGAASALTPTDLTTARWMAGAAAPYPDHVGMAGAGGPGMGGLAVLAAGEGGGVLGGAGGAGAPMTALAHVANGGIKPTAKGRKAAAAVAAAVAAGGVGAGVAVPPKMMLPFVSEDTQRRLALAEAMSIGVAEGTAPLELLQDDKRASTYNEAGLLGMDPEALASEVANGKTEQEQVEQFKKDMAGDSSSTSEDQSSTTATAQAGKRKADDTNGDAAADKEETKKQKLVVFDTEDIVSKSKGGSAICKRIEAALKAIDAL